MSKTSMNSKKKKPASMKRLSNLTTANVGHSLATDLQDLLKYGGPSIEHIFGTVDYVKIMNTCYICRSVRNRHQKAQGLICLNDHPNVPSVPSWEWSTWMSNIYGLDMTTSANTAWIHLVLFNPQYTYDFIQPLLQSIFGEHPSLEHILMVIPPQITSVAFIEGFGTRVVPSGFYQAKQVQTLYLLARQHFVKKYKIRGAVEEDNDDLVPLVHSNSTRLKECYGDYYIAEIIKNHSNSGRQILVAEHDSKAVAVLILNEAINSACLIDQFELIPFYGFRKPHPDDRVSDNVKSIESGSMLDEALLDDAISKLHSKPASSAVESSAEKHQAAGDVEEEETRHTFPEDDISLENISSIHINNRHGGDAQSVTSADSNTYSAMMLSITQYETRWFDEKSNIGDFDYETLQSPKGDSNESLPMFSGELNAFVLELAVSQPEHEHESIRLLLEAAFECYPQKEYCVMSVPSNTNQLSLYDHFVRCAPRPMGTYPHELYMLHRNSVLSYVTVRPAMISDICDVLCLIENMLATHSLVNDFLAAVYNEQDFTTFVIQCQTKIVGVVVLRDETRHFYLSTHYRLSHVIKEQCYDSNSYGLIKHLVLSPIFLTHSQFVLREILRQSDYSVLTYCINRCDTRTAKRDRPICSVLGYMTWVEPRRMPEFTQSHMEDCPMLPEATRDLDPFALYISTKSLCSLKHHEINTKIVIVGSSEIAIAFLEGLVTGTSKTFRANFANITVVAPHGLNHQTTDQRTVNMFVSHSKYSSREMQLLCLKTSVNIVYGVMTKIDRKKRLLVINDDSFISYDLLFLMCGTQYQKPPVHKEKKVREFPNNVFLINTETDASQALRQLKQLTESLTHSEYTIVVYGSVLETYCCIAVLLQFGVPGPNITFVESCPSPYEPHNSDYSIQIPNADVDEAIFANILEEGVTHHRAFYFADWVIDKKMNVITTAKFESSYRRLSIDCVAMFMYNNKMISAKTFISIYSAGLVFDGALIIDDKCQTNDPHIYAAGTLTKYSSRYYADHLAHKYFDLVEIGTKLGRRIRKKLIPQCDESPCHTTFTCPNGKHLVPYYTHPLVTFCRLPGKLQYLNVSKPGLPVPPHVASIACDYGHTLVTGDCKDLETMGYFQLHLNKHGVIENITCLAKFNIDRNNIISLWGKAEKLLNNLKTRFDMATISDFYEYFRQPWASAIYHDGFFDLENSILEIMTRSSSIEGYSPIEDLIQIFIENDWTALNIDQKEEMEEKLSYSPYYNLVRTQVLDFLNENKKYFTMYAHSYNIHQLIKNVFSSPLFQEPK